MASTASDFASQRPAPRVLSVDVLRGLTMFTMVFVNDIAGARGLPYWLGHYPPGKNGMTFVDVVFPAFLFIVGMSIPLAIEGRRAKGDGWARIYVHVLLRTLALLAIGVLMVESPDDERMGWREGLWKTLMYAGVIGAFHAVSLTRPAARYVSLGIRAVSAALLLYLAFAFRDSDGGHIRPQWWGILGLIGWAYFWAATAYLLLRTAGQASLTAAAGVFMCVYFADQNGAFEFLRSLRFHAFGTALWPDNWVGIADQWGSLPAVTMAGIALGRTLSPSETDPTTSSPAGRVRFAMVFATLMALAGLLLYPVFGIDKNSGTPTWCLFSAAITAVVWVVLYVVIDVAGWRAWAVPLGWAGASALLIYILADLWYATLELSKARWFSQLGARYPDAIWRGLLAAAALTLTGGVLGRLGFRLRV
jgi:predicted acyltransferase